MSARSDLASWLKPLLPKTWVILPYTEETNVLNKVTVMLNQTSIKPNKDAPIASHIVSFEAFVIEPKTDPAKREDALDAEVDDFLHALDTLPQVLWDDAEKVGWGNPTTNIAYRIQLTVQTAK